MDLCLMTAYLAYALYWVKAILDMVLKRFEIYIILEYKAKL